MKFKKLGSKSRKWELLFVLTVTVITGFLYFLQAPFLELIELKARDLHFQQRGPLQPSGKVGYVAIDEESVNREGRWPWPRRQMALLIKAVESYGAKVIGLDMGFFEPDLKIRQKAILDIAGRFQSNISPSAAVLKSIVPELEAVAHQEDDDFILSETIKNLKCPLVLGHFFYFSESGFTPEDAPDEMLDKAQYRIVRSTDTPPEGALIEAIGIEYNIPVVREATPYAGSFNALLDTDGAVRWMPLAIRYKQRIFPSLALQCLAAADPDQPLMIALSSYGVEEVRLGQTRIPTSRRGELQVNFYGPGYTFPHWSATRLLRGEAPKDCLKDRIVVIGNTTMGLFDMRTTPFSAVFPGVELHCEVMENILQRNFFQNPRRFDRIDDLGAIILLAALFLVMYFHLHGVVLAIGVASLLAGYVGYIHYNFLNLKSWTNHVYPMLNLGVCYLGTTIYRYMKEEREKQQVRSTFSLYVPRSVVEEMLANPDRLRLGGEKRELSVLFSDIRGFTTLSEKLPAEELVPQLNEYLTRMTELVFNHNGTLDKYIGDAIMAIFGAPLPQEDHALRSCLTALDMVKTLETLHGEWRERGKPVLNIGIGINTGMMMVGNMGSERRFDYTVLGDNVNLASRLEGLTKMYGVSIVVSGSTWEYVKEELVGRELDVVRVKGKQLPVPIHQIMDVGEAAVQYAEPLEAYREAMEEFRKGNWEKALRMFQGVEKWWPGDAPSRLYQERCLSLLQNPPGADWSHITTLDHK